MQTAHFLAFAEAIHDHSLFENVDIDGLAIAMAKLLDIQSESLKVDFFRLCGVSRECLERQCELWVEDGRIH
jgi:hypothetical protein